jgi:hypothetical protein
MKRIIILSLLLFATVAFAYDPVIVTQGAPYKTIAEVASNSVQTLVSSLSEDIITKNGKNIVALYISCETYALRYAYGANPTTTFGHILYPGQGIYIVGAPAIKQFRYTNATAGQNAVLTLTAEY